METVIQRGGGASKPQRESGIELFRILSMLLIVAHHYVVNSGMMGAVGEAGNPFTINAVFVVLFGAWGKMGINCFLLITGWFMCKSEISVRKYVKLLLQIYFYKIVIGLIFLLTGYEPFSLSAVLQMLLPIKSVSDGFTSCFLLFYLCIPFLNILIRNMNRKQHLLLLALTCFIYVVLGTVPKVQVVMNYVSWFIVLYFIASYLRLYPFRFTENCKFWGFLTVGFLLVDVASIVILYKVRPDYAYYFMADSNKVLSVLTAICAFMFFKNLHFSSRFINAVASAAFGVLLIHANSDAMRRWLWQDVCRVPTMLNSAWLYLHAIGCVLVIYVVCTAIDMIRIYCIEKNLFRWLDKALFYRLKNI